ncbi:putative hexose transport-related protein [Meredithblackwellia eburnea MCA 4105]
MSKSNSHPPARDSIPTLESLNVDLHPDTVKYVNDPQALADAIGGHSLRDLVKSPIALASAVSACLGGLLFGFDQGILSLVYIMPRFLAQFPEIDSATSSTGLNKGVMTGLLELGAFLGALVSGFVADRYSRKRSIALGIEFFLIGSTLQASSFSYAQLVVGRMIGGIGVGILASTAPMYISEISAPNVRGSFLALEAGCVGLSNFFSRTYGTRFIYNEWCFRTPFTLQMLLAVLLSCILWKLPYSPRWLVQVGRDIEALHSLARLRALPIDSPLVQAEWINIRAEAIRSREVIVNDHPHLQDGGFVTDLRLEIAGWIDLFKPKMLYRTSIGIMLMFFQQFQGINALIYYSPSLFASLGLSTQMQIDLSGVTNICQMITTCSAFILLDRVGRKPPLLVGSVINTFCHFLVAGLIAKYSSDWAAHSAAAWVCVAAILLFMLSFGAGWSPVPWALPAECFSSSRRAKGVAVSVTTNWLGNFIIGLITPPFLAATPVGTFVFFGAFAVLSFMWTFFFCPETKGKTLEDIDSLFHSKQAREDTQAHYDLVEALCNSREGSTLKAAKGSEAWVESA